MKPESLINASKAFQIALEDPETISFIKTNFSHPEKRPGIISRKWLSKNNNGYKWNVEIIEKNPFFPGREAEMINVVLIEIDSRSGKIIKRHFFSYIFFSEYKKFVTQILSNSVTQEFS